MSIPTRSRSSAEFNARHSAIADRLILPLQRFIHDQTITGLFLLFSAIAALILANSPWHEAYKQFNETVLSIHLGSIEIHHSVNAWINDGLMVFFFFLVGLEINNQLVHGELSDPRKALLPAIAAVGGMAIPALIYLSFNWHGPSQSGWGIPVATDIAFALGVLSVLGSRVPVSLRIFLLTLATVDDIGGILVIAIFYSTHIVWAALVVAVLLALLIRLLDKGGIRQGGPYLVVAIALWIAMFMSGIHPTIAGVIVGLLIPAHAWIKEKDFSEASESLVNSYKKAQADGDSELAHSYSEKLSALAHHTEPLSERLQRAFSPAVNWIILPIFAFSNSGVVVSSELFQQAVSHPVVAGVFFGLIFGKLIGIFLFSWLAVKLKLATLPSGVKWSHIAGVSLVAGIGFTVSLFITQLALHDKILVSMAKLSVLGASCTAAIAGYLWLRFCPSRNEPFLTS